MMFVKGYHPITTTSFRTPAAPPNKRERCFCGDLHEDRIRASVGWPDQLVRYEGSCLEPARRNQLDCLSDMIGPHINTLHMYTYILLSICIHIYICIYVYAYVVYIYIYVYFVSDTYINIQVHAALCRSMYMYILYIYIHIIYIYSCHVRYANPDSIMLL